MLAIKDVEHIKETYGEKIFGFEEAIKKRKAKIENVKKNHGADLEMHETRLKVLEDKRKTFKDIRKKLKMVIEQKKKKKGVKAWTNT